MGGGWSTTATSSLPHHHYHIITTTPSLSHHHYYHIILTHHTITITPSLPHHHHHYYIITGSSTPMDISSVTQNGRLLMFSAGPLSYGFWSDTAESSNEFSWLGSRKFDIAAVKTLFAQRCVHVGTPTPLPIHLYIVPTCTWLPPPAPISLPVLSSTHLYLAPPTCTSLCLAPPTCT